MAIYSSTTERSKVPKAFLGRRGLTPGNPMGAPFGLRCVDVLSLTMIRAAEYQVQTTQDQNTLGNAKGSASSFARKGLSSGDHCGGSANAEKNALQEMSHHVLKDTCCWQKFTLIFLC